MLHRLYKVIFKKFEVMDLELFNEIEDFLSKRKNGSYGELLFPTKSHFDENYKSIYDVNNKILVALYANDNESASVIASDFVNFMKKLDEDYSIDYHPVPLVYISVDGPKYIDRNFIENLYNDEKIKGRLWFSEYFFNSFSFRLKCQIHQFDELVEYILNEFVKEGYEFTCEYYF